MNPGSSRRAHLVSATLWSLSLLAAVAGVFWLPWFFSSTTPVPGESFALGFNNRFGILALGASLLLAIAARYLGARPLTHCAWLRDAARFFPPWKEARAEYSILLTSSILWSAGIFFWGGYITDPAWVEARGFIYGMDLLAVGVAPYRDYMYNYGPATLYLPFGLSNLTGGLLSFEQSYLVALCLFTIAGFVSLFVILRILEIPTGLRPVVLLIAVLGWATFTGGLQYTPLRFVVVPVALILLDAVARREFRTRTSAFACLCAGSFIALFCCIALSPEMGICGFAGLGAYCFILLLRGSFPVSAACGLGAILAGAAALLAFPGYLLGVLAFAAGGENFPIYPNLHNVVLVSISLITIPSLIASAIAGPGQSRAPLAASLAVGGGMLLPAALGRCDPGHVYINSLVPILMMFPATASAGKAWVRGWSWCCAILYVLCLQFSYWNTYEGAYADVVAMRYFYEHNPRVIAAWKNEWTALLRQSAHGKDLHWSKTLYFPDDLTNLTKQGSVLLTNGNDGNLWLVRFLLLQKKLPRDYFGAYTQGAVTKEQIDRKLRDTSAYEFLMMPLPILGQLSNPVDIVSYARDTSAFLSKLLLFPVTANVKFPPCHPDSEYARRLLLNYEPFVKFHSYIILKRRETSPALPPF